MPLAHGAQVWLPAGLHAIQQSPDHILAEEGEEPVAALVAKITLSEAPRTVGLPDDCLFRLCDRWVALFAGTNGVISKKR